MVNINEFADLVVNGLELYFGDGFSITTNDVLKNNGVTYLGLNINDGSRVAPIIYLNSFYEKFSDGEENIDSIVEHIVSVYRENRTMPGGFNVEDFMDFGKVKEHLSCKLINAESNKRLLEDVPHKLFLDLALVFMFSWNTDSDCGYSILIRNEHVEHWKTNEEEMYDIAMKNIKDNYELKSMAEVMASMTGMDIEEVPIDNIPMSVLSSKLKMYGAIYILNSELLKGYADEHETDVVILPSSVHECILLPIDNSADMNYMKSMIQEVNATQLQEEEILSDHPYIFKREEAELVVA